jgi:hypothetical protein
MNIGRTLVVMLLFMYSCQQKKTTDILEGNLDQAEMQIEGERQNKSPLRLDFINLHEDSSFYYIFSCVKIDNDEIDYKIVDKEARKKPLKIFDDSKSSYEIPTHIVEKYFLVDSIIWIYNVHSTLIGKGKYIRHELHDLSSSISYVGVYKIEIMKNENHYLLHLPFYYSNKKSLEPNLVKWIDNPKLSLAQNQLKIKNEYQERIESSDIEIFQYKYNGEVYTFYSDWNINVFSDKILGKRIFTLENAMIIDMSSTNFLYNNKPVFLLACAQPETDNFYSLTLCWDGEKFGYIKCK